MYRPPASVAGWAADLDLPVGVAQVLLAGLREAADPRAPPDTARRLPDPRILREVADGVRRL